VLRVLALVFTVFLTPSLWASDSSPVRIVGSTSVFPFSALVAERIGFFQETNPPIVERTGTGAGIKLFCAGFNPTLPDIVNTSRPFNESERALCHAHGVSDIFEVKIGYGGIILAQSRKKPEDQVLEGLTLEDLYKALSYDVLIEDLWVKNPYHLWSEVNENLPNIPIVIFGPPSTSGIRDTLRETVFERYCGQDSANHPASTKCGLVREDEAYIEMPENTMLIVQKLEANPMAIGILAYPFLDRNRDKLRELSVNGILPDLQTILSGVYPLSRPLYFYVKAHHIPTKGMLKRYLQTFLDESFWDEEGLLSDKGLIPPSPDERKKTQETLNKIVREQD
jgi:phosphate transport system substrate-binding protein